MERLHQYVGTILTQQHLALALYNNQPCFPIYRDLEYLSVVDASSMLIIASANANAASLIASEKGAFHILESL